MIPAADRWGPFAEGLEPGERVARLRCLRTLAHVLCGPRGLEVQAMARAAERDPAEANLRAVLVSLDRLAAMDRRHVLASYAAIQRGSGG